MALMLSAASRESLAAASDRLDALVDASSGSDLAQLGDDLYAVLRLLSNEISLRRHLADPAIAESSRTGLAGQLLRDKIGRDALDVVSELVGARWSRSVDLVAALEELARRAVLGVAEKGGTGLVQQLRQTIPIAALQPDSTLDDVEDELFRFGRILDREPRLGSLLADQSAPADKRVGLLREVLGGRVSPVTETLLEQTVRTPRSGNLERAAEELSELAAARRDRYVAHVRTAVRLSPDQEHRLAGTLNRLYGRPISLQIELDPDLLGGLVVRIGGELIDGSVSSKLAAARRTLSG
ncbi:MAG TPA: ATP synthase F1 subunit delta [Nocardioides sp.]|nr:ATP synthase F1 subunit delta [Nocardioides sp.]